MKKFLAVILALAMVFALAAAASADYTAEEEAEAEYTLAAYDAQHSQQILDSRIHYPLTAVMIAVCQRPF